MSNKYERFWSSGDSDKLLRLARDIETQDSWRGFLTIQEHDIFKYALERGGSIWREFVNGNVICRLEQQDTLEQNSTKQKLGIGTPGNGISLSSSISQSKNRNSSILNHRDEPNCLNLEQTPKVRSPALVGNSSQGHQSSGISHQRLLNLDPVTVAFRVRYMLYEKSIQVLFPSPNPDISSDIDYQIFEQLEIDEKDQSLPQNKNSVDAYKPADRKIDDDYDESDEDNDINHNQIDNGEIKQHNITNKDLEYDSSGKHIITSTLIIFFKNVIYLFIKC